ncbi:MAG: type II toxin-antitoxin system RelE family toxin [Candidatus Hodarchaeales archaeon]
MKALDFSIETEFEVGSQYSSQNIGTQTGSNISTEDWLISFSSGFRKNISSMDKKRQGRILEVISKLSKNPMKKKGNSQIPLSGDLEGKWRVRIGDYRLIYYPEPTQKIVYMLAFGSRGQIYR